MRRWQKRTLQFLSMPLRPIVESRTFVMRSGPARGLRRQGGLMFFPAAPSREEQFLTGLDLRGKTVYDVGANIGVMSLFFARAVGPDGNVIAIEPNPDSIPNLRANIECNEFANIEVLNVALGASNGSGELVVNKGRRGRGSMQESIVSRFLEQGDNRRYDVEVFDLDGLVTQSGFPAPDFVKIDTEGMEYECVRGMTGLLRDRKPGLFIELHGLSTEKGRHLIERLLGLLWSQDYSVFGVQAQEEITPTNWASVARGHLYCA